MREGERGEEGARTGRGNGDDVVVARRVACRPSEPVMAHNLARSKRLAMVRPFVAITSSYDILPYVTTKILPIIPPPPMVAAEITRGRVARDKGLPVSARPGPRCK